MHCGSLQQTGISLKQNEASIISGQKACRRNFLLSRSNFWFFYDIVIVIFPDREIVNSQQTTLVLPTTHQTF